MIVARDLTRAPPCTQVDCDGGKRGFAPLVTGAVVVVVDDVDLDGDGNVVGNL
jgi:hypothetical protein